MVVRWDFGLSCGYDFYFCWSLTEKLGSNFACGYAATAMSWNLIGDIPFREGDVFADVGRRGDDGCPGERERDGEYRRLSRSSLRGEGV